MPGDDLRQSSIAILDVPLRGLDVSKLTLEIIEKEEGKGEQDHNRKGRREDEYCKTASFFAYYYRDPCRTAFQATVEDVVCQPPMSNFSALAMREQFQLRGCSSTL
ncbi:hypothetical protein CABS01_03123 [Colletotrichum abscissum]|uniref:uncharacterized protein n=1 Tax=Colletotrichum abscissum TaxID=1671311 RepID=UPI0027D625DD|nr:uncharacterized protein CABS01_03123 [Colletotrichum abscissum]KAK1477821.1 hypothetical protein CABS01_03123 [Colletotrichum abscissum]